MASAMSPLLEGSEARILAADEEITFREREALARLGSLVTAEAARLLGHGAHPGRARRAARAGRGRRPQRSGPRREVDESDALEIVAGRHPVVEAHLGGEPFIPNDCHLGGDVRARSIVTGPNMGGKSTWLRQTALIMLLAQIGSWVPAERARVGLVDRIFTRVGAQDDLARGSQPS